MTEFTKKTFDRALLVGGASMLALVTAGTAQAQDAASASPEADAPEANEIIVTAQRRAERLEDVPVSIVAISGDTLARTGVQRLSDLGQVAAGVQINRGGSFTQPAIRGISTLTLGYGFENNVATYVDGFYQPDMVTINGDLANLASVQVLKGPQGALYGRNAMAGAIVIETLAPSQEPVGKAQISYGRFNDIRAQAYVSVPLSSDLAISLAGSYRHNDGYIHDIVDGSNSAPLTTASFRAKLLFTPGDMFKLTLGYNHGFVEDARGTTYTINAHANAGFGIPASPPRASLRDTSSLTVPADASAWANEVTGKIEIDTGIGTLTSYTGYAHRISHSTFDFDGSKPIISQSFDDSINERTFQQTLDYSITAIDNLDLIIGAFYYHDRLDHGKGGANTVTAAGISRTSFIFLGSDAYALYADATYHLGDRLFLTGSLRYSSEKRHINFFEAAGPAIGAGTLAAPVSKDATFHSTTPRVVLRYELASRTSIYASWGKGFRAGVFNNVVQTNAALVFPVRPERLTAYEIGFKTASSTFRFDAAAYYYDFRDLQVGLTGLIPGGVTPVQTLNNAKRAESYGADAQLTWTPVPEFSLRAGMAYTHARYTDFSNAVGTGLNATTGNNAGGQTQDWTGQQMARAPSFTGNAGFTYEHELAGGKLELSGNVNYTTSYVVANASLYGPTGPAGLQTTQRYRQDAYAIANAQINWTDESGHLTIGAYADNLTNTRYNFVLSGSAFGDYSQGNEPATYGVRLGFKY
jgi:iron complex outermembrane recepter protein